MPIRNSVDTAIENLNAADKAANELKAAALATIPAPVWMETIPFTAAFSDRAFNVRDETEAYKIEDADNRALFDSLGEKGLEKRGDPMAFHLENGRYKVLVGNRRFAMMELRRRAESDRRKAEGLPDDPDTLPFATIFGLVYTGLSHGQQIHLTADHIGRKELNEYEKCKEFGEVQYHNGLTDKAASVHFGIDPNKIARYRMRYSSPTVMEHFKRENTKGGLLPFVKVGQKALTALYTGILADRDAGCKFREEGANFRRVWARVEAGEFEKTTGPKAPPSETRKATTIEGQIQGIATYGEGPALEHAANILAWAKGDDVRLDVALQGLNDLVKSKDAEIASLQTAIEGLTADLGGLSATLAERDSTIANMEATITERDETIATLTADLEKARKTTNARVRAAR